MRAAAGISRQFILTISSIYAEIACPIDHETLIIYLF